MTKLALAYSTCTIALGLMIGGPAAAQGRDESAAQGAAASVLESAKPAAAVASQASGAELPEIVVTANRVVSEAQKTPTAITVYSGRDLAAKGVINVQSLAAVDPSVNVVTAGGTAYVAVRGISSSDVTEIGDPAVPIARDGFYTSRAYSIQASMYDISRVEVLKGPQGTLNGRNSTGGLISIITQRPEFHNGGYLDARVGNYDAFHGEGAVNLALSDDFAIRVSGLYDYHQGYRKVFVQQIGDTLRGDDSNVASGRIQFAWRPTPHLSLWASYQRDKITGVGDVSVNTPLDVVTPITDTKNFVNGAPVSVGLTGNRVRWEISYDALPGGINFIYSGGYDTEDWRHVLDGGQVSLKDDPSYGAFSPLLESGTGYPGYTQFVQHEQPKTWNHEVRFSNDTASRLFVQAGWFHFQEDNDVNTGVFVAGMTPPFAPGGPLAALSQAGNYGVLFVYPQVVAKSDAIFGYLTYAITDQIKISAGLRETWDHKTRAGYFLVNLPALANPFIPAAANPPPGPGNGDISESQPTFHVGLEWTPTPRSLVYVKYDTGYKAGGFNSNGAGPSVPYDSEKVGTAEIGAKNRFADNKVQLNVDAFYTRYTGYQGSAFSSALGGGAGVFNIGSATIYGADGEAIALFGEGGQFDVNATLLHTAFGQGLSAVDGAVDVPIGGNRLPLAPTLSFTAGVQQALPLAGGQITLRAEMKYSSKYYFSVFNYAFTMQEAYATGNVLISYRLDQGNWQVEAFVRNISDADVLSVAQNDNALHYNHYEYQPPRTFGMRGRISF